MKPSISYLQGALRKADEKLKRAEEDVADGYPDDAVSRAYYAVFHAITAVLATRGLSFSSHSQTIGAFNREFVHTGLFPKGVTQTVRQMFEHRQAGDYEWAQSVDAKTAADDVAAAKLLLGQCRDLIERYIRDNAT